MGDGRFDEDKLDQATRELTRRAVLIDMEELDFLNFDAVAGEHQLLGAVSAGRVLVCALLASATCQRARIFVEEISGVAPDPHPGNGTGMSLGVAGVAIT